MNALLTPQQQQMLDKFMAGPDLSFETITPELAEILLLTNPGNRNNSESNLKKIATDMYNDDFHPGNDALLFDILGRHRNGEHRLKCVIETGKSITFIVRRRVQEKEISVIDQGFKRTPKAGIEFLPDFAKNFGREIKDWPSVIRLLLSKAYADPKAIHGLSIHALGNVILHFKDSLHFIDDIVSQKKVQKITTCGPLKAVLVRMHKFGVDEHKLTYALNYLMDGGSEVEQGNIQRLPGTDSLRTLRDWLLSNKLNSGTQNMSNVYWTVETMLAAFINGDERKKVSTKSGERWPVDVSSVLPQEPQYKSQSRYLGDLFKSLCEWGKEQLQGEFKLNDVVEMVLGDGNKEKKTRLSRKLTKTIKEFGSLDLPGIGKIVPHDNSKKRLVKVIFRP